jgi:CheY-like chemotaxis protein
MQKPYLLLVEDEPVLRACLQSLFTEEGYQVETAANGREALQWLEHQPAQLVLTDLRMPVMDGYQLIERLLEWLPLTHRPAVIVYSGEADLREKMTRYLNQGAIAACLTKPTDLERLLETVHQVALSQVTPSLPRYERWGQPPRDGRKRLRKAEKEQQAGSTAWSLLVAVEEAGTTSRACARGAHFASNTLGRR